MATAAVENITDAVEATKEFLTPVNARQWLKLALVVVFLGTGPNVTTGFVDVPVEEFETAQAEFPDALPSDLLVLLAVLVVVGVLLALVWALLGAIFEFVLIESLREGDVRLRRYWGRRWRQGLRLFGFRIGLGIAFWAFVVALLGPVVVPRVTDVGVPQFPLVALAVILPVLFVAGILFALVYLYTTAFVVPIMTENGCGVLAGWRMLWGSMRANIREYALYTLVYAVLAFVLGIAVGMVTAMVALVFVFLLAVLGVALFVSGAFASTVVLAGFLALVAGVVVLLVAVAAVVQVPFLTYQRYYNLLVLGDVESSFDLIPDLRAFIRTTAGDAGAEPE